VKEAWVLEQVQKLYGPSKEYGLADGHPGGHRTSNMLDRVIRAMSRYFENGQQLHGSKGARERHCRAWALLFNFGPWHPATARDNQGWRSPAERLNQHRYHDVWLQNLLVSASLAAGHHVLLPRHEAVRGPARAVESPLPHPAGLSKVAAVPLNSFQGRPRRRRGMPWGASAGR
jgi:hypothetical protein